MVMRWWTDNAGWMRYLRSFDSAASTRSLLNAFLLFGVDPASIHFSHGEQLKPTFFFFLERLSGNIFWFLKQNSFKKLHAIDLHICIIVYVSLP